MSLSAPTESENKKRSTEMKTDTKFHFLYLGNLFEAKGCLLLLEACLSLKAKGYDFMLDVIGGETNSITAAQYRNEITIRSLSDQVTYHGKKYGEEKEHYFRRANAFVFPTFYSCECFPIVILEAMQHSLPVISTYEGGIPDLVLDGETGYLIPQRDLESLTEKMKQLLLNPEQCIAMGKAGHVHYKKHFTQNSFEHNFITILKKLIEG